MPGTAFLPQLKSKGERLRALVTQQLSDDEIKSAAGESGFERIRVIRTPTVPGNCPSDVTMCFVRSGAQAGPSARPGTAIGISNVIKTSRGGTFWDVSDGLGG